MTQGTQELRNRKYMKVYWVVFSLKLLWSPSCLYAAGSDAVLLFHGISHDPVHTGTLQPAWSRIKLCCFPFLRILPAVWQLWSSQHLPPQSWRPRYHSSSIRVSVPVWWCGRRRREAPPFLLTSWGFSTTLGELQLQEWQNCVTAQPWLPQKCQRFETSFKMCAWVPLKYPLR